MEDRHLVALSCRRLELLLPGVEREMAERARRHHCVRAGFDRLLDRLEQLSKRSLLARLDDRETAALDLRRIVHGLPTTGVDDGLERPRAVGVLETEQLRGPEYLAPIEGSDAEPLQAPVRHFAEPYEPVALRDQPEEVLHLDSARVARHADALEVVAHALAERIILLELKVRLPQVERADVADRHERVRARRLGVGEDARVQVQVVVRLRFVNVARPAARDRL